MDSLLPHTPTRVSPEQWLAMLQCLAADADHLHGDPDASAERVVALALRWFAVAWPAITPRLVAASCRATIANGTPSLPALPAAVQLLDSEERMAGWIQRGERWEAPIRPQLLEQEPPKPRQQPSPPPPPPEPTPAPAPAPQPQREGPDGWLTIGEVCKLLGTSRTALRVAAGWLLSPEQWSRGSGRRPTRFSDAAVEELQRYLERRQDGQVPAPGAELQVQAQLDQLLAEVRADS